jgi:hydroxypyruvate isomerase
MPQFAANLSMLFTETPLLERFGRAARAGFTAVELQFPYEQPATVLRDELVTGMVRVLRRPILLLDM